MCWVHMRFQRYQKICVDETYDSRKMVYETVSLISPLIFFDILQSCTCNYQYDLVKHTVDQVGEEGEEENLEKVEEEEEKEDVWVCLTVSAK